MEINPLRIIQISDMHIFRDPEDALLGVKTRDSLHAVIDLIKKEENMDLIILSGDLSQDGSPISYERIAEMFQPFGVPVYCVPGNHDNSDVMETVYPRDTIVTDRHIRHKNWQLILLDSHKRHAVEGFFDQQQFDFLKKCLDTYTEQAVIVFHHQPVPVGSKWLDKLGLTNADEFWRTLSAYPQVNTILFGHVHQEFHTVFNGIPCYSLPSTCIQFKSKQDNFALADLPPGYRFVHLFDDGHIETGVKRTDKYIGVFEAKAKGY